jgi:hypothetical protein
MIRNQDTVRTTFDPTILREKPKKMLDYEQTLPAILPLTLCKLQMSSSIDCYLHYHALERFQSISIPLKSMLYARASTY